MLRRFNLPPSTQLRPPIAHDDEPVCWYTELRHLVLTAPVHLAATIADHDDEVWNVAFAPDGRHMCTASKDCTVRLYSTRAPFALLAEVNRSAKQPE